MYRAVDLSSRSHLIIPTLEDFSCGRKNFGKGKTSRIPRYSFTVNPRKPERATHSTNKNKERYKKKDSDWLETFGKRQVENYKLQPYHFQADLTW